MSLDMERGIIILIVGILVVFLGLVLLVLVFQYLVPYLLSLKKKEKQVAGLPAEKKPAASQRTGEEITAIAAAIHLFMEDAHDEENAILTIGNSPKSYSPWSSKIYGLQQFARK